MKHIQVGHFDYQQLKRVFYALSNRSFRELFSKSSLRNMDVIKDVNKFEQELELNIPKT